MNKISKFRAGLKSFLFCEKYGDKEIAAKRNVMILCSIFSLILFYLGILTRFTSDYYVHTETMKNYPISELLRSGGWKIFTSGYPLWYIVGKLCMKVLGCPADIAAGISTGLFLILTYVVMVIFLNKLLCEFNVSQITISVLCFVLMIVGPIWRPWVTEMIIVGNGGINVWHNATNICGRSIGVIAFFTLLTELEKIYKSNYSYFPTLKNFITDVGILLLSIVAKPSFAQSFAPAFGLTVLFILIKSKGAFWKHFIWYIGLSILPTLLMVKQISRYYGKNSVLPKHNEVSLEINSNISFAQLINVIYKEVWILLFAVIVILIVIIKKEFDLYNLVACLMLLISKLFVIFLGGLATGEMGWTYYIAAFIVFMIAIRDYCRIFYSENSFIKYRIGQLLFIITTFILGIHFCVGLFKLYKLIICGNIFF